MPQRQRHRNKVGAPPGGQADHGGECRARSAWWRARAMMWPPGAGPPTLEGARSWGLGRSAHPGSAVDFTRLRGATRTACMR